MGCLISGSQSLLLDVCFFFVRDTGLTLSFCKSESVYVSCIINVMITVLGFDMVLATSRGHRD